MRPEKESILKEMTDAIDASEHILLADYSGMKVKHFNLLRTNLRAVGARSLVVKNSLFNVALGKSGRAVPESALAGKTLMVTGGADITAVAKSLKAFIKDQKVLAIKGGSLNTQMLSEQDVDAMADMPPREVMLGRLVGTVQAPMTQFVGVMHAKVSSLLYVLTAIEDKKKNAA
jgi:large subunit ribosomal protein L10